MYIHHEQCSLNTLYSVMTFIHIHILDWELASWVHLVSLLILEQTDVDGDHSILLINGNRPTVTVNKPPQRCYFERIDSTRIGLCMNMTRV